MFVTLEERKRRLEICETSGPTGGKCQHNVPNAIGISKCDKMNCPCPLVSKTAMASTHCPIGRW